MTRLHGQKSFGLAAVTLLVATTLAAPVFAATARPIAAGTSAQDPASVRAFASVTLPKHSLYVGESIPITIQAYYAADTGVTITGSPETTSSEFTLAAGDPKQGTATRGGASYLVATWKGRLSPAKPGHYALRVKVPSTLEWRAAVRHAAPSAGDDDSFGDIFDSFGLDDQQGGDPFAAMQRQMQRMMSRAMQDFDVGPMQKQDVVLMSPGTEVTVLPLPAEGRPSGFSGAVGHFSMDATAEADHVRVGEPIELRMVVRGDGNLDRVSMAGLPESAELKTYPPSATRQDDTKTFVQAVIPQRAGATQIPPVEMSYFDPDAARYVTLRSSAIPIDIKPGQALAATSSGATPDAISGPALAPNADIDGSPVRSLRPLYTHKGFWLAQLVPLGTLATAAAWLIRRRRAAADPYHALRRGAQRALKQHRAAMDRALAAGDASAFFAAARGALQQRFGALWGIVPEAISLVEIERRMQGPQLETLRGIFEADAARFGVGAVQQDLAAWNKTVRRLLAHPEAP